MEKQQYSFAVTGSQLGLPELTEVGYAETVQAFQSSNWSSNSALLLLYLLDGRAGLQLGDDRIEAGAGMFFALKPSLITAQDASSFPPKRVVWIRSNDEGVFAPIAEFASQNGAGSFRVNDRLRIQVKDCFQLLASYRKSPIQALPPALRSMVQFMVDESYQCMLGTTDIPEAIRRYLERHSGELISMSELSAGFGLDHQAMCEVFQERYGMAPRAYLTQCRIAEAKDLLRTTTMPVQEIAFEVGFRSSRNFIATFADHSGSSPAAYRDQAGSTLA